MNYYQHSKQLFACSISPKSTPNQQKILLGTIGSGNQSIIYLQTSNDGYRAKSYLLTNAISIQLQFIPLNEESDRFISAGEKLQLFKCDEGKVTHLADLLPLSREYNGSTSCFDLHYEKPSRLISGSTDSTISIWDLDKKKCINQWRTSFEDQQRYITDLTMSKDYNIFAYLNSEQEIAIFDIRTNKGVKQIFGKLSYDNIIWHNDMYLCAMAGEIGVIDLYDIRNINNKYKRIRTNNGQISKAEWFQQTNGLMTAGEDGFIIIHSGDEMEPQLQLNKLNCIDNICCENELIGIIQDCSFELIVFD